MSQTASVSAHCTQPAREWSGVEWSGVDVAKSSKNSLAGMVGMLESREVGVGCGIYYSVGGGMEGGRPIHTIQTYSGREEIAHCKWHLSLLLAH